MISKILKLAEQFEELSACPSTLQNFIPQTENQFRLWLHGSLVQPNDEEYVEWLIATYFTKPLLNDLNDTLDYNFNRGRDHVLKRIISERFPNEREQRVLSRQLDLIEQGVAEAHSRFKNKIMLLPNGISFYIEAGEINKHPLGDFIIKKTSDGLVVATCLKKGMTLPKQSFRDLLRNFGAKR